jgi:hypothetical protein
MFRTAIRTSLVAAGLALPAAANAAPPVVYDPAAPVYYTPAPVCQHWTVLYRTCGREPWRAYRSYETGYHAERAAHFLRHRGFEATVAVAG